MKLLATAVILAATAMSLTASACKNMDSSKIHSVKQESKWAALENPTTSSSQSQQSQGVATKGADGSVRR